jgi:hypothetical protein
MGGKDFPATQLVAPRASVGSPTCRAISPYVVIDVHHELPDTLLVAVAGGRDGHLEERASASEVLLQLDPRLLEARLGAGADGESIKERVEVICEFRSLLLETAWSARA